MIETYSRPGALALADGTIYRGVSFGAFKEQADPSVGEVVFNTSMYGYQEILTDPSYAGQILCFTYPHIGNVGCNDEDEESGQLFVRGMVVRELSRIPSNFRARRTLSEYLSAHNLMGLCGIDTREIVQHLRDNGAQMGAMASGEKIDCDALVDAARAQGSMLGKDYVQHVSCKKPYSWNEFPWLLGTDLVSERRSGQLGKGGRYLSQEESWSRPHVVALDCGIKYNILRLLLDSGFRVTVAPATSDAKAIMSLRPDALFLSNGPGDPATLGYIVKTVKDLVGRFPIFGICLGHQIIGQAFGGKTYKMKFGHRGGNHPVKNLKTGSVEITVQNHGFTVDPDTLSSGVEVTHINLNDGTVEGLDIPAAKTFSIQYHPEASPGPHDSRYLFRRFFEQVVGGREKLEAR